MTNIESNRYRAYAMALEHLKNNAAITDTVPALKEVTQSAILLLDSISDTDKTRSLKTQTGAAGKYQFQAELAKNALIIASAIVSFASRNNNQELKQSMSYTRSELDYANDPDMASRTANILATARKLNGELNTYGITEDLLNKVDDSLASYRQQMIKPRNQVTDMRVAGKHARESLRQLKLIFDEQLDTLMIQFRDVNPDFYNSYIVKRTVINPSRRKTRLEGMATDGATGAGIGNVLLTIKGSLLTTTSMSDGSFSLKTPPLAGAVLECTCGGYKPVTITVDVKLGQALNLTVVMEKV